MEKQNQKTWNESNQYKNQKVQLNYTLTTTMSDINNIKNWSDTYLKEDDNDSNELTDAKYVEWMWCVKVRREEEDQRQRERQQRKRKGRQRKKSDARQQRRRPRSR